MDAENDNKRIKMNTVMPAVTETSGEGLPYAPENWPKPGDVWGWRTGKRVTSAGHFVDRYLYAPMRLCGTKKPGASRKQRICFASKLSIERYIKTEFPETDVDEFFALFTWKIPAILPASREGNSEPIMAVPLQQIPPSEPSAPDFQFGSRECKVKSNY